MSQLMIGLLIGGVLAAVFFGLSGIFAKASNLAGISLGYYILAIGTGVIVIGCACLFIVPDRSANTSSLIHAFLSGASWAIGAALVGIALAKFHTPISQLVPLYNMNTLVAVVLGLFIFSEWQGLHLIKLIAGAFLIIIGGVLVAWA
jgi:uncharacterized membrane protein